MEENYLIKTQAYINSYLNFIELKKVATKKTNQTNIDNEQLIEYITFLSGCTKRYELLFDQAWKAVDEVLVKYYKITSYVKGSPHFVLKKAYEVGLIESEVWLDMLDDRNDGTHVYKEKTELDKYISRIFNEYEPKFQELSVKLRNIRHEIFR